MDHESVRTQEIHAPVNRLDIPQPHIPSFLLEDFYITLPGLPSSAEVQAYAEKQSDSKAPQRKAPLWAPLWALLSALLGGLVLVAVGLFSIVFGIALNILGPEFWR